MAFVNDYDVGSAFIGTIIGFEEKESSRTGYQISMLHRGEERTMDITKEAYQIRWDPNYDPYPVLGEEVFMAKFDENGVICELIETNDISQGTAPVKTGLVLGTTRMFKKKITAETPTIGDILKIDGDTVTLVDFDRNMENGEIAHCVCRGAMPELHDGVTFKLAEDVNVYVWDWSSALAPFHRCSREEAKALNFVERFQVGSKEDLMKNCYWANFYSTRGNENEIDLIKCFLNKEPGWIE